MAYGALKGNPAIYLPNAPAFGLGLYYTYVFAKHTPPEANWLPGTM